MENSQITTYDELINQFGVDKNLDFTFDDSEYEKTYKDMSPSDAIMDLTNLINILAEAFEHDEVKEVVIETYTKSKKYSHVNVIDDMFLKQQYLNTLKKFMFNHEKAYKDDKHLGHKFTKETREERLVDWIIGTKLNNGEWLNSKVKYLQ